MKMRILFTACIAAFTVACEPPVQTIYTGEEAEAAADATNENEDENEDADAADANQNEDEDENENADDDAAGDAADAGTEEPQLCEFNSDCSDGYVCDHVAGACFALPGGTSFANEDEDADTGAADASDSGGTVEAADADDDAEVTPLGETCGDVLDNDGDGDVNEGCPPSESDEDAADDEDVAGDEDENEDEDTDADDDAAEPEADDGEPESGEAAGCASNADCASNESCLATACVADADRDTIPDANDNCPGVANYLQEDADSDNTGDACEPPLEEPAADEEEDEDEDADTDAEDEAEPAPLTITVTWPSDAPLGDDPWLCGTFLGLGWQCVSIALGGEGGRTMTVTTPFTSDRHYFNACSGECDDPLYGYWLFIKLGDALAERSAAHLTVGTASVPYTLVANPQNTGANGKVELGAYPSTLP